jgi:uncharacterized protein with FMN-binding domain
VRRALVTLGGLVVGTTVLVSLKSAPGAGRLPGQVIADAAAASPSPTPSPGHSPTLSPGLPAVPTPQVSRSPSVPPPPRSSRAPAPAPPPAAATGPPTVILGDSAVTEFGYVTVGITVAGGRITDVILDEMPGDEPRSVSISAKAGPVLRQRALAAQNTTFDSVSGATWTSDAFKVSLRSAMSKAGLSG